MMDANDLKGLAVVTIEDGIKVGTVNDILFNTQHYRIQALLLDGGLLRSSTGLVELVNVQTIGSDAVMIQNQSVVRHQLSNQEREQYPSLENIMSLPIVAQDGSVVGKVATVNIDPQSGKITELLATKPGFIGVFESRIHVPVNQLISIGRDAVIVPDHFDEEVAS
jgi:uncharacterized protein YrrD